AVEDVSVVNLQVTGRFQAHGLRDHRLVARNWELPSGHIDQHGSITNYLGVEGELAEGAAFQNESDKMLNIFVIIRKPTEVVGPQGVGFIPNDGGHDEVRLEIEDPIEDIDLLDGTPVVIQQIDGVGLRSQEYEMRPVVRTVQVKIRTGARHLR